VEASPKAETLLPGSWKESLKISIPRDGLEVNHLEEILLQEIQRVREELWESVLTSLPATCQGRIA
jgi:hypothetical protein